jgi:betaine-aldehyde dehydrogenase
MRESRWDMGDVAACSATRRTSRQGRPAGLVDTGNPTPISRIVYEPIGVCALIGPGTTRCSS